MNSKSVKIVASVSLLLVLGFAISCIKRTMPIAPPVSTSVTLKNGLLLYLPFNGTIADSSGNNNPSVIINSAGGGLTTDEHGNPNSAWGSNGSGAYVRVTNNGSIWYDSAFSVSFNVMVYSNNLVRQAFLCFDNTANAYGPGIAAGLSIPYQTNYFFGVQDSTAGCDNVGSYITKLSDTSSFSPLGGVWYNIINVYENGTAYVYVDGQLIGAVDRSNIQPLNHNGLICPESTINIGYWWDQDMESLNGKIDEVRLYNRSLTVDEISALANKL
jgi:hypothetical protein